METGALETRLSSEIRELELEAFVLQLEVDGLCVVPPEKTGVDFQTITSLRDRLLTEAEALVGCGFDLDTGPKAELTMKAEDNVLARSAGDYGEPTQFLVQQLLI